MGTVVRWSHPGRWQAAYWGLFFAFLVAAALNMAHVRAGFATSYLADLVVPAWLYIVLRGGHEPRRRPRLYRMLGATPEFSAVVLFVGSTLTEFTQMSWPTGLFAGTYDPLDIAAYGVGVGVCYALDRSDNRTASTSVSVQAGVARGVTEGAEPHASESPNPARHPIPTPVARDRP